ncbi:MAG: hypothetical protein IPK15_17545 [Verrucomicrobia bacterium]|nr:hypothetical protein [Verrucomicrobiota bacterium]
MNAFQCFVRAAAAVLRPSPSAGRISPPSPVQPDLTPGYVLVDGDIQVPLEVYTRMTSGGIHAAGTFGPAEFWNNNVVPFDFVTSGAGAVSAANQMAAINAMNAIAERAGVNFRPATSRDADRIRFQNSQFNNSPIGRRGGAQIINITSWNNQIIICHEIYHSLGFQHEQSRPDRDTYISINANNICGAGTGVGCPPGRNPGQCCDCLDADGDCVSCARNFEVRTDADTYGPYDFDSFMHYGRDYFSCNGGDTIVVNSPWRDYWQSRIGQRNHFSRLDALTCRALYPFPNDRWLDRDYTGTARGTFSQPFKHTSLAAALANVPVDGTLLVKHGNSYAGVGTYDQPVTIIAPAGDVYFGN